MRPYALVAVALLVSLTPGCIMDLPTGVLLERPRVLGARTVFDDDAERAAPRPGDEGTLRFYTASNDGVGWTAALTACVAAPSFMGIAGCAGDPFAFALPGAPSPSPELSFVTPGADAFAGGSSGVLFAGVLCAGGTPNLEPDPVTRLPTCDGEGATTEVVTFLLPIAAGMEPPNRHPSIADETITVDGQVWAPPSAPPSTGCASAAGTDALPSLTLQDEETPSNVVFTSDPADREEFQELVLGEMPMLVDSREDLEITHLASAGEFDRLTTEVFDDDAPDPEVEWIHPAAEDVPADGLTVRFFFVVRDGRGGMDWTERALCVVP